MSQLLSMRVWVDSRVWQDPETELWIGYCGAFNVYAQGDSPEKAITALQDAVNLLLKWRGRRCS